MEKRQKELELACAACDRRATMVCSCATEDSKAGSWDESEPLPPTDDWRRRVISTTRAVDSKPTNNQGNQSTVTPYEVRKFTPLLPGRQENL
jgi:hypothetical protein